MDWILSKMGIRPQPRDYAVDEIECIRQAATGQYVTWSCHVCHKEREDGKISVLKKDISSRWNLPAGTAVQNVRYCNDNEDCIRKADTIKWYK